MSERFVLHVDREPGYYWLRASKTSPWIVGEWAEMEDSETNGYWWFLCNSEWPYDDSDFETIGQRIEEPEEPSE